MARLDFDRWDYAATRLLLLAGLVGIPLVVVGLPLLGWLGDDPLVWGAALDQQAAVTDPALRDGARVVWDGGVEVTLAEVPGGVRLLTLLPALVVALAAALVAWPLLGLVRRIQGGESFSTDAVRGLRVVGLTLLLAPWLHQFLVGIADAAVLEEAFGPRSSTLVIGAGTLALSALGLAVGAVAEAFRQGVHLRDDVDGLV